MYRNITPNAYEISAAQNYHKCRAELTKSRLNPKLAVQSHCRISDTYRILVPYMKASQIKRNKELKFQICFFFCCSQWRTGTFSCCVNKPLDFNLKSSFKSIAVIKEKKNGPYSIFQYQYWNLKRRCGVMTFLKQSALFWQKSVGRQRIIYRSKIMDT